MKILVFDNQIHYIQFILFKLTTTKVMHNERKKDLDNNISHSVKKEFTFEILKKFTGESLC